MAEQPQQNRPEKRDPSSTEKPKQTEAEKRSDPNETTADRKEKAMLAVTAMIKTNGDAVLQERQKTKEGSVDFKRILELATKREEVVKFLSERYGISRDLPGYPEGKSYAKELKELSADMDKNYEQMARIIFQREFDFDTTATSPLALLRTMGLAGGTKILLRSGGFTLTPEERKKLDGDKNKEQEEDSKRSDRRVQRTTDRLTTILRKGIKSPEAEESFNVINGKHRAMLRNLKEWQKEDPSIPTPSEEDFQYVLSTFITEQIRFNKNYGWRPMESYEKEAVFRYWKALGEKLLIGTEDQKEGDKTITVDRYMTVPWKSVDEVLKFSEAYEQKGLKFAEENARITAPILDAMLKGVPDNMRGMAKDSISTLFDPRARDALGLKKPSAFVQYSVIAGLKAGAANERQRKAPERARSQER